MLKILIHLGIQLKFYWLSQMKREELKFLPHYSFKSYLEKKNK